MDDRRRPLTVDEAGRLAAAIDPGARVVASEPLLGGIDWGTYTLELDGPSGRRSYVVRRHDGTDDRPARAARRLWDALVALEGVDLPIPRPVLFDDGASSGAPSVVMTRCDGELRPPPAEPSAWIHEVARTLVRIQEVPLDRVGGSIRPCGSAPADLAGERGRTPPQDAATWATALSALEDASGGLEGGDLVLRHADYYCGNVLWTGERITGIVDWSEACIGPAAADLAYARLDMHLALGRNAAHELLRRYADRRGAPRDLPYWDLRMTLPAMRWLPEWVRGYAEIGVHLALRVAAERLAEFQRDAVVRLADRSR